MTGPFTRRRCAVAIAALALLLFGAPACSKSGKEARCREAVRNIFRITELDKTSSGPDEHAAVRSCRANASSAAVDCMIAARTAQDLAACEGGVAGDLTKGGDEGDEKGE